MLREFPVARGRVTFSGRVRGGVALALAEARPSLAWNLARELPDTMTVLATVTDAPRFAPITDYGIPEGDVAHVFVRHLDEIVGILQGGGHVHVSCYGGRGRTGLALACIASRLERIDPDAALARAHATCGGPETDAQRGFVRSLFAVGAS